MKASFRLPLSVPLLLFVAALFCSPHVARGQTGAESDDTIRIDTELVNLNVSVFNRDLQRPAGQLAQKDFVIIEDGAQQEITFFASATAAFDLVLLLDLSGSTADKLDLIRSSARRFVELARPTDRISIVTFTDKTRLVSPLTSDRVDLLKRIKKIKEPEGGTNFYDALRYVLEDVLSQSDTSHRKAIVVMTDGVDNALPNVEGEGSWTSFQELLYIVSQSESIVVPIYLDTERDMVDQQRATEMTYLIARQRLTQLATESGSIVYQARKVEDLKGVYEQVIRDLGTVYSLGYRPSKKERDGSWRTVAVRLLARPELATRTRRGYYAK
jgi:VWFA-related protein